MTECLLRVFDERKTNEMVKMQKFIRQGLDAELLKHKSHGLRAAERIKSSANVAGNIATNSASEDMFRSKILRLWNLILKIAVPFKKHDGKNMIKNVMACSESEKTVSSQTQNLAPSTLVLLRCSAVQQHCHC